MSMSSLHVLFDMTDRGKQVVYKSRRIMGIDTHPGLVLVRVPSFGLDWMCEPFEGCVAIPVEFNSIGDGGVASEGRAF